MFGGDNCMSMEEVIRMAKDAEDISIHQGFLKACDKSSWNYFEKPTPCAPGKNKYWEKLMTYEFKEREDKILENITGSEADILRFVRFNSTKAEIEEYVKILQKLLKAGCFDENERQKEERKNWEEREKNFGKKVL